jgi:glyceraldehyde 3-phosphate dehydrogenase
MKNMVNIAINGFGRVGRLFLKSALKEPSFNIVAINDLGDIQNLAYLLKYDTVYGRYAGEIAVTNGKLVVDGKEITFLQEKDATKLPWKDLNVDIVVEATGVFESYEKASVHIASGAKRVVITAPAKDADGILGKTVLLCVNEAEAKTVSITSNGSCTTNAVSPVIQVMAENPGILKALLSTTHAYTATQSVVDGPTKGTDYRRGRAAAQNMSPSTTGAAISVTRAFHELEGKFDGIAIRVPVPAGSLADITFVAKRKTTVEEVNEIFRAAAKDPKWKNILKVTDDQIVSSDILGEPFGSIVDLGFTKVVDGDLVKVLAWYDNEAGYVSTLMEHTKKVSLLI